MRILLTRALEDAERTAEALAAAGHEVVHAPVIDVVATGAAWPERLYDGVLATSAQAFTKLESAPSLEAMRLMPLHLVGERTASSARSRGFGGGMQIAASAAELMLRFGTSKHKPKHLLYLAGRHRKPDIEAALEAASQHLDVVEIYEAKALHDLTSSAIAALAARQIDVTLHFSPRSARLFTDLSQARGLDLSAMRHLCLSADVAAVLSRHGLPIVDIADQANEAALLRLVERTSAGQDA